MESVSFNYYGTQYTLDEEKCVAYLNDENQPIIGLEFEEIMSLLKKNHLEFEVEYFESSCETCQEKEGMRLKAYPFLEYHFFAFTKDNQYVMSSLSQDYESMSYEQLEKQGKVNAMYLVSIIVCKECGEYTVEVESIE